MFDMEFDRAWDECCTGRASVALARMRTLADQLDDADPALICRCEWLTAWALCRLGELEEAFAHARLARLASSELEPAVQAKAATLYGMLVCRLGLNDEAYTVLAAASELAKESGDDWVLAFSLHSLADTIWMGGDPESALELTGRTIAIARSLNDLHLVSWILIKDGCILTQLGDTAKAAGDEAGFVRWYEKAIDVTLEARDLARANGDCWAERTALANAAEYVGYLGRFEEAHQLLERWTAVGGDETDRMMHHYLATCSEIYLREGKIEAAWDCCQQALDMSEEGVANDHVHTCVKLLSKIHEELGNFETALQLYKRYHNLQQTFEGERVKQRARVAAIMSDTELLKKQAAQSELDALTDPLTGVGNRRRFERVLEAHEAEGRTNFAIAFADLDHFKAINDQFSHAVGDEVIRAFAQLLQESCRIDDLVARVGGEEFVLLLEDTNMRGAAAVCRRLQTRMRKHDWSRIAPGLTVTVSIGVALASEAGRSQDLLALADARLYRAKADGRNRVVIEGAGADRAGVA
ncbi:diguanylate cyclase [Pelagibacterium halotolerans]|uniref:sensor domain-containing diguanylate cyclase n=1 Tax=Pelagibacterium halotolerans TaxID=531813 RepID=UPI00384A6203